MGCEHLFSGNGIEALGSDWTVPLPPFILRGLEGTTASGRIMVGAHEIDPCLTAWDPRRAPAVQAEVERQRLRDEAAGAPVSEHSARARRAFGFVEEGIIERGRLALPAMMRRKACLNGCILFVGTGTGFEIWNAELAREADDAGLRGIAEFRLGEIGQRKGGERG